MLQISTEFVLPQTTLDSPLFFPAWQSSQDCLNLRLSTLCAIDYGLSWFILSIWTILRYNLIFQVLIGKESTCQCRRCRRSGLNPWVRKIPLRREWQPTPVFLPENSMDRGVWWTAIHEVAESDMTEHAHITIHQIYFITHFETKNQLFFFEFPQGNICHPCE